MKISQAGWDALAARLKAEAGRSDATAGEKTAHPHPCAHCHAQGQETELTVYDRWQCTDLAACAKRQLARRSAPGHD